MGLAIRDAITGPIPPIHGAVVESKGKEPRRLVLGQGLKRVLDDPTGHQDSET
jgi:hypothetical protein